jgi:hypothetical protein
MKARLLEQVTKEDGAGTLEALEVRLGPLSSLPSGNGYLVAEVPLARAERRVFPARPTWRSAWHYAVFRPSGHGWLIMRGQESPHYLHDWECYVPHGDRWVEQVPMGRAVTLRIAFPRRWQAVAICRILAARHALRNAVC